MLPLDRLYVLVQLNICIDRIYSAVSLVQVSIEPARAVKAKYSRRRRRDAKMQFASENNEK